MAKSAQKPLPVIHEATIASDGSGAVFKGAIIDESAAVARRKAGLDVVVCGKELAANRALACRIETQASPRYVRHPPHMSAGPMSLPHYQPDPRPPDGHTFYEGVTLKAH
jgi:hypothetical protein